jgi:hypothetical protein
MLRKLGDLLKPRRRNISPQLLAAVQCVRSWRRASFRDDEVAKKLVITNREIELLYSISTWDDNLIGACRNTLSRLVREVMK